MTPGQAIRRHCIHCCGGQGARVTGCDGDELASGDGFQPCGFHPHRLGKGRPSVRLIRRFCLACQGGKAEFVRDCISPACVLYPFRMGKNPNRAGIGCRDTERLFQINPQISHVSRSSGGNVQRSLPGVDEGPFRVRA